MDDNTHENLPIDAAGSTPSTQVINALSRHMNVHDAPAYLRLGIGAEIVRKALLLCLTNARTDPAGVGPSKSWQNGTNYQSTACSETNALARIGSALAAAHRSTSKPGASIASQSGLTLAPAT